MTSPRPRAHSGCYLDVSQLVLSDPRLGPYTYQFEQQQANEQVSKYRLVSVQMEAFFRILNITIQMIFTPDMNPIQGDTTHYQLSPFLKGFVVKNSNIQANDLNDFNLEATQACPHMKNRCLIRKNSFAQNDMLQDIIEIQQSDNFNSEDQYACGHLCKTCSRKQANQNKQLQEQEKEQDSNNEEFQNSSLNRTYTFMRESFEPEISIDFENVKKKLKQFQLVDRDACQEILREILFDHQIQFYLDNVDTIQQLIRLLQRNICSQANQAFKISFGSRRCRVQKFIQKKKRRTWTKKVSYSCRKAVADGRLRIKGKFVTKEQVCAMLSIDSVDHLTIDQIKELLSKNHSSVK